MRSRDHTERICITAPDVSRLTSRKVTGIRFDTLEAICRALDCRPGDLLEFREDARESG